jgi:hypothetical protein
VITAMRKCCDCEALLGRSEPRCSVLVIWSLVLVILAISFYYESPF